jgi:hypothetical protein
MLFYTVFFERKKRNGEILAIKKGLKRSVIRQDASSITLLFNNKLYKSMQKFSKPQTFNRMFANRRMKVFVGSLMLLVFSSVFYVQCAKENGITNSLDNGILASFRSNYVFRIEYDTEVTTHFMVDDDVTEVLDMAAQTPSITKQHVIVEIDAEGNIFVELTALTPSQSLNIQHETPEGNIEQPHKTVIENGTIKMFDANNEQLYEEPMDFGNAADLINTLQQIDNPNDVINQLMMQGQYSNFLSNLNEIINNPSAFGVTVTQVGNDLVAIQQSVNPINSNSDIAVSLVDKTNNRLISSNLYDAAGGWLSSMLFEYNTGSEPTLKGTLERSKQRLPSGLDAYVETYSTYENLQVDTNL